MNVECNRLLVEAILQKRLQMFMALTADAKETRDKVVKESFLIASKLTLVFVKEIPLNTYSEIRSKIRKSDRIRIATSILWTVRSVILKI